LERQLTAAIDNSATLNRATFNRAWKTKNKTTQK